MIYSAEREWREVVGYEGLYEVSNDGAVKNLSFGPPGKHRVEFPAVFEDRDGYLRTGLRKDGVAKQVAIHALVAEAFIGVRPAGMTVNHKDGNKKNNSPSNLEYLTARDNALHAVATGLIATGLRNGAHTKPHRVRKGENHGRSLISDAVVSQIKFALQHGGLSNLAVGFVFGVHPATISCIRTGRQWGHVEAAKCCI